MEPTKYLWRWVEIDALSWLELLFFKKQMDQKWNFHPLFAIFRENQVATWESWPFFHWLSWVGSRKYKNLLKLSYYDYTNGKVLSVTTSLHGFLLAFRLHNLKVPGSNPVGSKKSFFHYFWSIFRWKHELFLLVILIHCIFYDII